MSAVQAGHQNIKRLFDFKKLSYLVYSPKNGFKSFFEMMRSLAKSQNWEGKSFIERVAKSWLGTHQILQAHNKWFQDLHSKVFFVLSLMVEHEIVTQYSHITSPPTLSAPFKAMIQLTNWFSHVCFSFVASVLKLQNTFLLWFWNSKILSCYGFETPKYFLAYSFETPK